MGELAERALLPLKSEELRRKLGDAGREHERQNFAITKHMNLLIVAAPGLRAEPRSLRFNVKLIGTCV
ncbi:MAG: hypothetical protein QXM80_02725 [Thermofilaceae archaeon]